MIIEEYVFAGFIFIAFLFGMFAGFYLKWYKKKAVKIVVSGDETTLEIIKKAKEV